MRNNKSSKIDTIMINTVKENVRKYTNDQVRRANEARRFQQTIRNVSDAMLREIVKKGMITNCPITIQDIDVALDIYGPNIKAVIGKTTRTRSSPSNEILTPIPGYVLKNHSIIKLLIDIFYVNQISFLMTLGAIVNFITVHALPDERMSTIKKDLDRVIKMYESRGFKIAQIDTDGQFEPLKTHYGVLMNICAQEEHVAAIEKKIRLIKERHRADLSGIPFAVLPRMLVIYLVYRQVMWLNSFPSQKVGISKDLGPREIVTGRKCDYKRHCQLQYGEYVQVFDGTDNSMKRRRTGAIALCPSGNQ